MSDYLSPHFDHGNHALRAGWALGTLLKAGLKVEPEQDEEGNYTDVIVLSMDLADIRLRVLPEEGPDE